jgi:hypothetical protein
MLEERMEDVRAVLDAVGSKRATLLGYSEAGTMVALFAATYPERTSAIIMISSFARRIKTVDYPWGATEAQYQSFIDDIQCNWGGPVGMEIRVPSRINDLQFKKWWAKFLRMGASPATAAAITRMNIDIDVRDILPLIKVPTLIIHARGDQAIELGHGEYLAENIPNSTFVVVDTSDHLPWVGAATEILEAVEEFVTGIKTHSSTQRVLSTLMFTDIVDSTRIAQSLGDKNGGTCLKIMIQSFAMNFPFTGAKKSILQVIVFLLLSTDRRVLSGAPRRLFSPSWSAVFQ